MSNSVEIYTDGSCLTPNGSGGWAFVFLHEGGKDEVYGCHPKTTNNRMEMTAAIRGLAHLSSPSNVVIYSDSQLVCNGGNSWIYGWKRHNWTRKGSPLANADLWEKLYDQISRHNKVEFVWVKGHAGNTYNELCDMLAGYAAQKQVNSRGRRHVRKKPRIRLKENK